MKIALPRIMDTDLTYYLGGPMTGIPNYNKEAFEAAEEALVAAGLKIKSPHSNPWPDTPLKTDQEIWQYFMRLALRQLLDCQGSIFLRGFTFSRGAMTEANISSSLQMPMYFLDGEILVPMHRTA